MNKELATRLGKMLVETMALMEQWITEQEAEQVAEMNGHGDRLLTGSTIANRLGCSLATLMRRANAGKYPFMFKDGGLWVGSEDGLERWIKNQIKRSA